MIVPVLLAASLGLAACGGGDSESSGLSRSELAKKADAICAKAETQSKGISPPANFDDATESAAYFDQIAPITHKEAGELAALTPDDDAKDDWEAFVARQKAGDELLQTIKRKADTKDPSGQQDLLKVAPTGKAFTAAAKKIGAKGCAS